MKRIFSGHISYADDEYGALICIDHHTDSQSDLFPAKICDKGTSPDYVMTGKYIAIVYHSIYEANIVSAA